MSTQTFNLSMPKALVEVLDERAKKEYSSRSDYIRKAVINQMRIEESMEVLLNKTNKKGSELGIKNEQQVYDIIADK